jgi:hypothetical protein
MFSTSNSSAGRAQSDDEDMGHVAQVVAVLLNVSNLGHLLEKMNGIVTRGVESRFTVLICSEITYRHK